VIELQIDRLVSRRPLCSGSSTRHRIMTNLVYTKQRHSGIITTTNYTTADSPRRNANNHNTSMHPWIPAVWPGRDTT
jgi:hypothetical protein